MFGSLVVSIHDVAPSTVAEVRWLLSALDSIEARPRVLKVIPNEDARHDLRDCAELVELLQREQDAGSEIVLHGYTHRAARAPRGPWPLRVRARLFAGPAAEFLSLDEAAMAERIAAGLAITEGAGLAVQGFCAPAWLSPPGLAPLLQRAGLRYLIHMASVEDLSQDRCLQLPWSGYMGAGPTQERLIALGGRLTRMRWPAAPAVKVFLHPQHARTSAACRRSLDGIARLLRDRHAVTYAQLLSC